MTHCPLCANPAAETFLTRTNVPVHQHLVMADQATAKAAARGALDMAVCAACGFVFNAAFDAGKLNYGGAYDNTQAHSGVFDEYMDELVGRLLAHHRIGSGTVVEVGCGKGQFLRKLVAAAPGIRAVGFDPSYQGPESEFGGRLSFRRAYYDGTAGVAADVVICRHVIEHIAKPQTLLDAVAAALKNSPQARVFFETPCVEWIFDNAVLWDVFYEHCSLFSAATLSFAFARAGFQVEEVDHVFGGQYLWLAGHVGAGHAEANGAPIVAQARRYAAACTKAQETWARRIDALKQRGPVALWGAGAKGVTFANLLDPERAMLDCAVDINPNKQGRFIPGTGHPIVAPRELVQRRVKSAILLNPNYRTEIRAMLASTGAAIELVDGTAP